MIRQALVVASVALSTQACGMRFGPAPDSTVWQRTPLPPDPALAAKAIDGNACRPSDAAFPVQVVLQDQRTEASAAFLLAGGGMTGSCLISPEGGGGGWSSGPLAAMTGLISIDEQGSGGSESRMAYLGGRAAPGIVRVEIALSDGSTLEASVGNEHWLGWWPGTASADRVTSTSAIGAVTVIAWQNGGWTVQ